jgi:hypothetical protein
LELLDFKEKFSSAQNNIGSLEKQSEAEKKKISSLKQCMLENDSALFKLLAEAKAEQLSSTESLSKVKDAYERQKQNVALLKVFVLINPRMITKQRI